MCGLVKFYFMVYDLGIKFIIGIDFWVINDIFGDELFWLMLLVMNNEGYKNIIIFIFKVYLCGYVVYKVVID